MFKPVLFALAAAAALPVAADRPRPDDAPPVAGHRDQRRSDGERSADDRGDPPCQRRGGQTVRRHVGGVVDLCRRTRRAEARAAADRIARRPRSSTPRARSTATERSPTAVRRPFVFRSDDVILPPWPSSLPLRWLYLDLNSDFASVEQQLDTELRGRPVAVAPVDTDSTARSPQLEAKAFGSGPAPRSGRPGEVPRADRRARVPRG